MATNTPKKIIQIFHVLRDKLKFDQLRSLLQSVKSKIRTMCERNYVEDAKKICLGYQNPDRKVRCKAPRDLAALLSKESVTDEELHEIFNSCHVYFLNGLRDSSEKVREQSLFCVTYLITKRLPLNDYYLSYIVPVFVERVGTAEVVEQCEEIRLSIVSCLIDIFKKYSSAKCLTPFYSQFVTILCQTLKDPFPDVREKSCKAIFTLEKAIRSDFHLQAETLLTPALACLNHKRFRVRLAALRAIGAIVLHCTSAGVNNALLPVGERLLDQNHHVRATVAEIAYRWLLKHRDRYSYFPKMIPLLISGFDDERPDIQHICHELWSTVGAKYLRENEKDLKDKVDYLLDPPDDYPTTFKRPDLGCRVLIYRHMGSWLSAIGSELNSWKADIRNKCVQLLCSLVVHCEGNITQHLQDLMPILFMAARDEDEKVVESAWRVSQFVGFFLPYEVWSIHIMPIIEDDPHYGHMDVLSAILFGSKRTDLKKSLLPISTVLAQDRIARCRKRKFQSALAKCFQSYTHIFVEIWEREVNFNFFKILTCLIALQKPENDYTATLDLYDTTRLRKRDEEHNFSKDLYQQMFDRGPRLWTSAADEPYIFRTLVRQCACSVITNFELVIQIAKEVLLSDADATLKINIFGELGNCFQHKDKNFNKQKLLPLVNKCLKDFIEEVIVPSLHWRAGKNAESIRTIAMLCLWALIRPSKNEWVVFTSKEDTLWLQQTLINILLNTMEDAAYMTRHVSVKCIRILRLRADQLDLRDLDCFLIVYPALLKRLDDPIDKVRFSALKGLREDLRNLPDEFLEPNFKAQRCHIVNVLLIHLDDKDKRIWPLASEALKNLLTRDRSAIPLVEAQMPKLMNREMCKLVLEGIGNENLFPKVFRYFESSDEEGGLADLTKMAGK